MNLTERLSDTPMIGELLPNKILSNEMMTLKTALKTSIHFYQMKIDFILFAVITTRPDIAFAVSRLARFNTNPLESHHQAAD